MNIDPYSRAGGSVEDEFKKIKEGKFPYPLKSHENGGDYSDVPIDNSKFIWDSLSDEIRATFFNIFSKEFGLYANPVKRPSARKWHHIFNSYLKYLNSLNDDSCVLFDAKLYGSSLIVLTNP